MVPKRALIPLVSSHRLVPVTRATARVPGSAASQPSTATPAHSTQVAAAVTSPPATATTGQPTGGGAGCSSVSATFPAARTWAFSWTVSASCIGCRRSRSSGADPGQKWRHGLSMLTQGLLQN